MSIIRRWIQSVVAHQHIFTITLHHGIVDLGDHDASACSLVIEPGYDDMRVQDVVVNFGCNHMCIYR